jgi:hypothetical protein
LLKDLDFPTDKNKIIQYVQLKEPINISKEKNENTLQHNFDERKQYQNVSEVTSALHDRTVAISQKGMECIKLDNQTTVSAYI